MEQIIITRIKEMEWKINHHYAIRRMNQIDIRFISHIENEIAKLKETLCLVQKKNCVR